MTKTKTTTKTKTKTRDSKKDSEQLRRKLEGRPRVRLLKPGRMTVVKAGHP